MKTEIAEGKIQVVMEPRGLVVSFKQAALFPSGEDSIAPDSLPSLDKVAAAIIKIPNPVRLGGHTDSRKINTKRFRSNWDLSTARAIALLDILTERFHVPEGHISVAGYADTAPIAPNDTEEQRTEPARGHRHPQRAGSAGRTDQGGGGSSRSFHSGPGSGWEIAQYRPGIACSDEPQPPTFLAC